MTLNLPLIREINLQQSYCYVTIYLSLAVKWGDSKNVMASVVGALGWYGLGVWGDLVCVGSICAARGTCSAEVGSRAG